MQLLQDTERWKQWGELVKHKDYTKLISETAASLTERGRVKTNTWGWVLRSDYENPRWDFLKRDKGVPYAERRVVVRSKKQVRDKYGNLRDAMVETAGVEKVIAPEYSEWEAVVAKRDGREFGVPVPDEPPPGQMDVASFDW